MANFFDQFDGHDTTAPASSTSNFFDQFDAPSAPVIGRAVPAFVDPDVGPVQPPGGPILTMPSAPTAPTGPIVAATPAGRALGRGAIQGVTFGTGDEIAGALDGAQSYLRGNGYTDAYEKGTAEARAANRAAEEAHPYMYGTGKVGGGIVGLIPAIAAGPEVLGLGATQAIGSRLLASAGSSTLLGGLQGFNEGEGYTEDRLPNLRLGAAAGGAGGFAAPLAGKALGSVAGLALPYLPLARDKVLNFTGAASRDLVDRFSASTPGQIEGRAAQLGPDAMLADLSPDFLASAQGLASKDSPVAGRLVDTLETRNAGTNARLRTDLDEGLGPYVPAAQVETEFAAKRAMAGNIYEAALSNWRQPVDTSPVLAEIGQRLTTAAGPEQSALMKARSMLLADGPTGPVPQTDPRYLHNVKGALDTLIGYGDDTIGVPRGSLSKAEGSTAQIRGALNRQLEASIPGYADANLAASTAHRASEALESGKAVLRGGENAIDPATFAADFQSRPLEQQAALRTGVRADIERSVGTNANDLASVRSIVKADGDWNPQKLAEVFGPDQAGQIMGAADREQAFRDVYNQVVRNSATAKRSAAAASYEVRDPFAPNSSIMLPLAAAEIAGGHVGAAAANVGRSGFNLLRGFAGRASDEARNEGVGRALTTSGSDLTDLIAALQAARDKRTILAPLPAQTDRVVQALIGSTAREERPNEALVKILQRTTH